MQHMLLMISSEAPGGETAAERAADVGASGAADRGLAQPPGPLVGRLAPEQLAIKGN